MIVITDSTFVQTFDGAMVFGDDACMPIERAAVHVQITDVDVDDPAIDPYRCPECGCEMRVLDKRNYDGYVRRRRQCVNCPTRMTTHETVKRISRNAAMPPSWARARE